MSEILSLPQEHKSHIFTPPCNILYLLYEFYLPQGWELCYFLPIILFGGWGFYFFILLSFVRKCHNLHPFPLLLNPSPPLPPFFSGFNIARRTKNRIIPLISFHSQLHFVSLQLCPSVCSHIGYDFVLLTHFARY